MNKFALTITTYNAHAATFAESFEKKFNSIELEKLLDLLPPNSYILDAGCGAATSAALAMSKGHRALGIDLSEGLLVEAKKMHPHVPTQLMSLTEITLPDNEFDGIFCRASLLHIDRVDAPKVIDDFYRILKPSGVLMLMTKEGKGEGEQPATFDPTLSRLFTFYTQEELGGYIEKAGFTILESYVFHGQSRKKTSRDQNWAVVFGKK